LYLSDLARALLPCRATKLRSRYDGFRGSRRFTEVFGG